jgi:hypothetical protein
VFLPGPAFCDAQGGDAGGSADLRRDVQEPVAQFLRLSGSDGPVEEQVPGPGEQVNAGQGELQPGLVDGELPRREPARNRWSCRSGSACHQDQKVERFDQILQRELLDHLEVWSDIETAQGAVDAFRPNTDANRPHQSLDIAFPR